MRSRPANGRSIQSGRPSAACLLALERYLPHYRHDQVVLDEILRRHRPAARERGPRGAFGPGFSAELALVEFL